MRACLTLLIVAGHLVAQVAALHAHADNSPDEHASLPHVHLSWFGNSPAPHADDEHHHEIAAADETPSTVLAPTHHDSDAVYLAAVTAANRVANQLRILPFSAWGISAALFDRGLFGCSVVAEFQYSGARCFADSPLYHCALFLQLQTLRI